MFKVIQKWWIQRGFAKLSPEERFEYTKKVINDRLKELQSNQKKMKINLVNNKKAINFLTNQLGEMNMKPYTKGGLGGSKKKKK